MSKIYGNYWGEDQIIVAQVKERASIPHGIFRGAQGAPAFIAAVVDTFAGTVTQYIFVEIIPGTERHENFIDLSGNQQSGICVKVNIFSGTSHKFEDMKHFATDSWPLQWFKLDKVPAPPNDPYAAYERAMSIVGARK